MHITFPMFPILAIVAIVCVLACIPCRNPQRGRSMSSLILGLLIVLVGTVLLLDRMGIINGQDVFRFWPVLLIIFGLTGIFTADDSSKLVGRGLIGLFGVLMLLMELSIVHVTLREIWPVFIIAAGLLMIWATVFPRARSVAPAGAPTADATLSPHLNVSSIFSDGRWTVTAPDFQNGYVRAVFGGFKVDLTQANMTGNRAYIDLDVVFGGGEFRIPDTWTVLFETQPVFGSCEDKTRRLQQPTAAKTLVIRGKLIFGGIEVRN